MYITQNTMCHTIPHQKTRMVVIVAITVSVIVVGAVVASVIVLAKWLRVRKIMSKMSQKEIELRRKLHLGWEGSNYIRFGSAK